jgi:hypothetical protein
MTTRIVRGYAGSMDNEDHGIGISRRQMFDHDIPVTILLHEGDAVGEFEPWMVEQVKVYAEERAEDGDAMLASDIMEIARAISHTLGIEGET